MSKRKTEPSSYLPFREVQLRHQRGPQGRPAYRHGPIPRFFSSQPCRPWLTDPVARVLADSLMSRSRLLRKRQPPRRPAGHYFLSVCFAKMVVFGGPTRQFS